MAFIQDVKGRLQSWTWVSNAIMLVLSSGVVLIAPEVLAGYKTAGVVGGAWAAWNLIMREKTTKPVSGWVQKQ